MPKTEVNSSVRRVDSEAWWTDFDGSVKDEIKD
jgi:hypothetical protein